MQNVLCFMYRQMKILGRERRYYFEFGDNLKLLYSLIVPVNGSLGITSLSASRP
jgi:hypothetical protein